MPSRRLGSLSALACAGFIVVIAATVLSLGSRPASAGRPVGTPVDSGSPRLGVALPGAGSRSSTPAWPLPVSSAVAGPVMVVARQAASALASTAFQTFVATFWDAGSQTFRKRTSAVDPGRADFWWVPVLWELVMDEYQRTGEPATRRLLDEVYDGALAAFPGLQSDFNDDRGWWALAATRAYELTHERRFLDQARHLFASIWSSWDGVYGGGIWWRRSAHDQKNVATNAPATIVAVRLYRATGERSYLDDATTIFEWMDRRLRDGDRIADHVEGAAVIVNWQLTYNYGTFAAAAAELSSVTGEQALLDAGVGVLAHATASLAPGGVLPDEGAGDGGLFKGVFVRCLGELVRTYGQSQFRPFLAMNAEAASASMRADGLVGASWGGPSADPIESGADASAVAVLELDALLP